MQKRELIKQVQQKMPLPLSLSATADAVEATFEVIAEALAARDKVSIPSFGSFTAEFRRDRVGTHPQTHEPMQIPARYTVKFRPSSILSERIAG